MGPVKKVMATLLAAALLIAASVGLAKLLRQQIPEPEVDFRQRMEAYPRPIAPPAQTVPETTAPPETTLPPETTVPVETQPLAERTAYEAVPLFYMTDYPEIRYRSGTLATSGSNVASLAMVASYLTGYEYTPDELADYFATYIGNSLQWLEYASDQLQLPWTKARNFHEARKALEEGKVVITLMANRSMFGERFIVLTGINEAGLITVNDPDESHYDKWNLKVGLVEGFENDAFTGGYQGSWIYDPAQIPGEPFLYAPEENTDEFRYPGVELTQSEIDTIARLIYMEAQSEPFEGQQAIAEVILNRLVADNFPDSIHNILHSPGQFQAVDRLYLAEPSHIQYEAIDRALNGPYVLPIDVVFFSTFQVNQNVWGTIGEHTFCYQWDS